MSSKTFIAGIAGVITFLAFTAEAKPSLMPSVSAPEDADKTVFIKPSTKFVNVIEHETVLFKVGEKQFALKFDGVHETYDLAVLAPAGVVDHKVKVYVARDPSEPQQSNP